ncbi:serine protease [Amycolatopsis speibonae]|uniref:Serine protease n=1 Tax=Amycolatopsis speibonae TaxID=1450224 RepID=A0ABV7P3Z2_9PSEU
MVTDLLIPADLRKLAPAQAEHEDKLLALPNVVGVALGHKHTEGRDTGTPCVQVLVDMKMSPDLLQRDEIVPAKIGATPTDVIEVGLVQAGAGAVPTPPRARDWVESYGEERDHLSGREHDPAAAALRAVMSTLPHAEQVAALNSATRAHAAGAPGICCQDMPQPSERNTGAARRFYVLSNNHVLARCNDAAIGDLIVQPAPADGGHHPMDAVARLARFVPLKFHRRTAAHDGWAPVNLVDAAIAEGRFYQLERGIHWIGEVSESNPTPQIGDILRKSGRAGDYTTAPILGLHATIEVNYPNGRIARFAKQIITPGALSPGGDSGAVATDPARRAVGLLFATSPQVAVLNPMPLVEHLLGVRIAGLIGTEQNGTGSRATR